mmetsp:Transcript_50485/g.131168  ORF Transcript_50485/g.131168 Transcript_50485/m.131168 type:complete len:193 (+) Transcript_50485:233-811(+)
MLAYHVDLPPTEFAIRMRPVFILSLAALTVLVVGHFMIRDFWGGLSLVFVVLMGLFVLTGEYRINASSACFFSVMAIISAIFDVVSCVLYFQHSKYKLGDPKAPALALLAQLVFLSSPVLLLVSALISYSIFIDCNDRAQELWGRSGELPSYDALGQGVPLAAAGPRRQGHGPPSQPPAPFQGQGRRLDGEA